MGESKHPVATTGSLALSRFAAKPSVSPAGCHLKMKVIIPNFQKFLDTDKRRLARMGHGFFIARNL